MVAPFKLHITLDTRIVARLALFLIRGILADLKEPEPIRGKLLAGACFDLRVEDPNRDRKSVSALSMKQAKSRSLDSPGVSEGVREPTIRVSHLESDGFTGRNVSVKRAPIPDWLIFWSFNLHRVWCL